MASQWRAASAAGTAISQPGPLRWLGSSSTRNACPLLHVKGGLWGPATLPWGKGAKTRLFGSKLGDFCDSKALLRIWSGLRLRHAMCRVSQALAWHGQIRPTEITIAWPKGRTEIFYSRAPDCAWLQEYRRYGRKQPALRRNLRQSHPVPPLKAGLRRQVFARKNCIGLNDLYPSS